MTKSGILFTSRGKKKFMKLKLTNKQSKQKIREIQDLIQLHDHFSAYSGWSKNSG